LEKSAADIMAMLGDLVGVVNEIHRNTKRETASIFTIDPAYGKGKTAWVTTNVDAFQQYLTRLEPTPPPKPEKPETDK
jgi:hypothetical protein